MAAACCAGVVKSHPFNDVNKRTGMLAAHVFLAFNGGSLSFDEPVIATMVCGLAAGEVTEEEIADWLRRSAISP